VLRPCGDELGGAGSLGTEQRLFIYRDITSVCASVKEVKGAGTDISLNPGFSRRSACVCSKYCEWKRAEQEYS
jgi:hypothetical protein